MSRKGLLIVT